MALTHYRLGVLTADQLSLLAFSMALSVLSLAKANSDMFDRRLIAERSTTRRPAGWKPKPGEGALVWQPTEIGTSHSLYEGDSVIVTAGHTQGTSDGHVHV